MLRWGLIPSWAKDAAISNRMINARQETVDQKPAFRAAFKRRRCVVLADGFFEWVATDGAKWPHYIFRQDEQPFALAGLWEHWGEGEARMETCTILTTGANAFMQGLHHRMPVILSPENARRWVEPNETPKTSLQTLMDPPADAGLISRPVSKEVNNPRNDDPRLLLAVSSDPG